MLPSIWLSLCISTRFGYNQEEQVNEMNVPLFIVMWLFSLHGESLCGLDPLESTVVVVAAEDPFGTGELKEIRKLMTLRRQADMGRWRESTSAAWEELEAERKHISKGEAAILYANGEGVSLSCWIGVISWSEQLMSQMTSPTTDSREIYFTPLACTRIVHAGGVK